MVVMLETFDAAQHALAIFNLLFGQKVQTRAWDGHSARSNATIKELETRRDGCKSGGYELWVFFLKLVFLLLARMSAKGGKGRRRRERTWSRSMEGWEEDFPRLIYTPV